MHVSFTFQCETSYAVFNSTSTLYTTLQSRMTTKTRGWKGKLALVRNDNAIIIWDSTTQREISTFKHICAPTYVIQLRNGQIVSGNDDHNIYVWDLNTGQSKILSGHTVTVFNLLELHNGNLLSEDEHFEIKLWDMLSGNCLQSFSKAGISALAQLADGTIVATDNSELSLLDVNRCLLL
jgi:WD40 repeat protein